MFTSDRDERGGFKNTPGFLESFFDNIPCAIGIYSIAENPDIIYVNEAFLSLYGYASTARYGVEINYDFFDDVYEEDKPSLREALKTVAETGKSISYDNRIISADGVLKYTRCILGLIRLPNGSKYYQEIVIDVTRERAETEAMRLRADSDPLTGLLNRSAAEEKIKKILAGEMSGSRSAMIMMDIDDFKKINDTKGHPFGDGVLKSVADILRINVRRDDIVARFGGDEFAVFMSRAGSADDVTARVSEIANRIRGIDVNLGIHITASFGIAMTDADAGDFGTIFERADRALYISKRRGKDSFTLADG